MNRLILVAVCVIVTSSGVTALGQYVVAGPMPMAVYRSVPVAVPMTTVYQPIVPTYAPVVTYQPPIVPAPIVYSPPVAYRRPFVYGTTVAYGMPVTQYPHDDGYLWPAVAVPTRFYVPGQPVRNVVRAVAP